MENMKVQCTTCESNYNVREEKIPDAGAKIKCPKCENIISVMKPEPEPPPLPSEDFAKGSDNTKNHDLIKSELKKCPYCAEKIHVDAIKCKHCKEMLDASLKKTNSSQITVTQNSNMDKQIAYESQKKNGFVAAILNFILPGVGYMYCGNILLGLFALFLAIVVTVFTAGLGLFIIMPIFIIDGFLSAARANKKLGMKLLKHA
jgi:predicted Zn finger-like uncharacterized protein